MKPQAFKYVAPRDVDHVLDLLASYGGEAKIIAGGQSLVPMLNLRVAAPQVLIDINQVAGISHLDTRDGLTLGALTRQSTLEDLPALGRLQPLIARAIPHIAHRPIRNRGTVGGSMAHADPAAEWGALSLALDATLLIARKGKAPRAAPAHSFFKGWMETTLEDDELLTEIRIPRSPKNAGHAFVELARRHGDFALAGVACRLVADASGRIAEARVAMTGIADTPRRLGAVEALLQDETPSDALFDEAAEMTANCIEPPSGLHASADYRRRISRVLVHDALIQANSDIGNHDDVSPEAPRHTCEAIPGTSKNGWRQPDTQGAISLTVNGTTITAKVDARTTLADFLRSDLALTGTHIGCEHGICGACTVRVDGRAERSCIRFAAQCDGAAIDTVEGLATDDDLHPLQRAFGEHGALQCGFCTPGFLMTAAELVDRSAVPDERQVREALSGSLCRCTGYEPIVQAVMNVLKDGTRTEGTRSAILPEQIAGAVTTDSKRSLSPKPEM